MPLRTPTHSFGYWTDLLSNGAHYANMPMGVPDEALPYQHGMPGQYQQPNYTTSRPDPPIGPHMQQSQQAAMNAAAKRRWSMRTTSSGRTVVPARDSMRDSRGESFRDAMRDSIRDSTMTANSGNESRPGSIMSSVFHFGGN